MVNSFATYAVYTYNTTDPAGIGMAGRLFDYGAGVTPLRNLTTGLNGDPQVEGVVLSNGDLRAVVTNRVAPPGLTPDTFVYDAAATSPSVLFTEQWPNVRNIYGLVKVGDYLYALDYDNARITEIDPADFSETGVTYTLASGFIPAGFQAQGQAVIEIDDKLFGLFTFPDSTWENYAPSLLVRFTIQYDSGAGKNVISVGTNDYNDGLVKNAFSLAVSGSDLYVAGLGGAQVGQDNQYNANSRLQKIAHGAADLKNATVYDVLQPSSSNPYEIRDISFDGSTAYVLWGTYNGSWSLIGKLEKTSDFTSFTLVDGFTSGAPGYFWAAQYTPENNRIWFAKGNEILVYDAGNLSTSPIELKIEPGSLISTGDTYDSLNDFAYVGATGTYRSIRGYRSPTQVSQTPRGRAARTLAAGKPELSAEQMIQIDELVQAE